MIGSVSGVHRGRAREGFELLLNKKIKRSVREWNEVNSRVLWVRVQLRAEK